MKLTADILLHPGQALLPRQRKRFRQAALRLYASDQGFAGRLWAYLPLFGLRWLLILLNEFIPERWRRRVLAGEAGSWSEAKAQAVIACTGIFGGFARKTGGIGYGRSPGGAAA